MPRSDSKVTAQDVVNAIVSGLESGLLTVQTGKQFASGSRGYYVFGKLNIGGEACQFGAPITIVGSKPTN